MSADLRESSAPPGLLEEGAALDPRRRLTLLQECRDMVVARLSAFIADALDRIGAELTGSAMQAVDHERQQAMFDAVALVREHRHDIEFRFRGLVAELFEQRLFEHDAAAERAVADAAGELALVDDQALDARLVLGRLARSSRRQLDPDAVLGVRARLATLLDRDWFDEDDYPASPELVFEALQQALDPLTASAPVRTALLQAFEPWVTASVAEMHANLNERLLGENVLPSIRLRPMLRDGASPTESPAGQAGGAKGAGAGARRAAAGGFHLPASARAARDHPETEGFPRDGYAGSGYVDFGYADSGPVDSSRFFHDLVRRIQEDRPGVQRLAARALADPGTFGAPAAPMPGAAAPLIEALHALQAGARNAADVTPFIAQAVDRAREQGSPLDRLTVDIVSLVFDYIYSDRRLPDPVKQQLLRLQVVAVKAALLDRSFFARRQHPMRRLIDRISALATDPDIDAAAGAPLVDGIVAIVDWVLESFDDDLVIFDEALARIEQLARASEEERAARLAELARQAGIAEALALAREEAHRSLAACIDATTPPFVRAFLDEWWSRVLARAHVDGMCAGLDWAQAMRMAQTLVWSVAPKVPDEVVRLAACLPQMITALIGSLQETGMEEGQRRQFFDQLLQWHTQVIRDAKAGNGCSGPVARWAPALPGQTDRGVKDPKTGNARGAGVAQRTAGPAAPASGPMPVRITPVLRHAIVDTLQRGDLIELLDDDDVRQIVKLAWISPGRRVYILSRFPDFGKSFERTELISWIASGRARRVDPHSAVDSAIDAIAGSVETGGAAPAGPSAMDGSVPQH